MKRSYKYLMVLFCLLFCLSIRSVDAMAAKQATVYISVERFTVGQGYIVTPTKITVEEGTKVSEIVEKVLRQEGYEPDVQTNSSYGWYLAGIYKGDTGKVRVPVSVMELDTFTYAPDYPTGVLPPSENYVYPELAEFSYQNEGMTSGWFYYANHRDPGYGMAFYGVKDQDVIRLQFTLCMGDLIKIADLDPATKSLAIIKEYLGSVTDQEVRSISEGSLAVLSDMDAEKELVSRLQEILQDISADVADGHKDGSYAGDLAEVTEILDQTKAHDVALRIERLPDIVSLADQEEVDDVSSLYGALTQDQKNKVESEEKEKLGSLVSAFETLKKEQQEAEEKAKAEAEAKAAAEARAREEEAARAKAEAEAAQARAKQEAARKEAAAATAKINAIGSVTLAQESAIAGARKAYDALSADAKKLVSATVLSKLTSAEKSLASLKQAQALKKKYTPAKVKLTKAAPAKKKVKLTWKKIKTATGYEVWMSAKKSSGYKKIATIKKAKKVTYTKAKLKSKKTMYFRVRAYRKVGKVTYYGAYSAVKKAKVK